VKIHLGKTFPKAYQGGAFVAFQGSWNRAPGPREPWFARRDAKVYGVVLDGRIGWGRSDIGGDPIVVVVSEAVSDAHLAGLPDMNPTNAPSVPAANTKPGFKIAGLCFSTCTQVKWPGKSNSCGRGAKLIEAPKGSLGCVPVARNGFWPTRPSQVTAAAVVWRSVSPTVGDFESTICSGSHLDNWLYVFVFYK
jgi:hypothetical protein